jgi:transcriptional regulator with XRE-family HTH domain
MPLDRKSKTKTKEPAIRRIVRENIRARRVECGMSQKALGERIGVVQQWIQQLESANCDNVPSLYLLEDLALQLGTTAIDLLTPGRFRDNRQ